MPDIAGNVRLCGNRPAARPAGVRFYDLGVDIELYDAVQRLR